MDAAAGDGVGIQSSPGEEEEEEEDLPVDLLIITINCKELRAAQSLLWRLPQSGAGQV